LVDVAQDVVITQDNTDKALLGNGILLSSRVEGGEVVESLGDRVLGRCAAQDVFHPETGELLIADGTLLDEKKVRILDDHGIDHLYVHSVITCMNPHGLERKCYGRDLATGKMVNLGEAVGVIAAQSIGEPGTQLTMRTFHIGGAASKAAAQSSIEVKRGGMVKLHNARLVTNSENKTLVVSRSSELTVHDAQGRERERYKLPYGCTLLVADGDMAEAGKVVVEWDPHTHPIIAESSGFIEFADFIVGKTVETKTDEITGITNLVIKSADYREALKPGQKVTESMSEEGYTNINVTGIAGGVGKPSNSRDFIPKLNIRGAGNELVSLPLPKNSVVLVKHGHSIAQGDILARVPQETSKTRDITGGLPRVADLFEARVPKDPAIMAEISGIVKFGKETKGKHRLIITNDQNEQQEILIPKWRHINVFENEHVDRGDIVVDGAPNPHDILRILGVEAVARYIIDEVQAVYRLQGVKINDKHIEVIIRQMLRKVEIKDPGESRFVKGEQVDFNRVLIENRKLHEENKLPIQYERILLGITKASLSTESFVSAASFQETTRVLTEAAVSGKRDELAGLKENVIVGRLIPAGTGFAYHKARKSGRYRPPMPKIPQVPAALFAGTIIDDDSND
jgi:DNA-directed RNA polymerase subunit beta'